MISAMRIVNAVLAVLLALIGVMTAINVFTTHTTDIAYRLGQVIGILIVVIPITTVFFITWRGLSSDSTVGGVKRARIANTIAVVLFILFCAMASVLANSTFSIWHWFIVLIFWIIPFALNIKALEKKRAELDQSVSSHRERPAQEADMLGTDEINKATNSSPYVTAFGISGESTAVPQNKKSSSNYFMRHWRGELSLGISYWVNGSILAGIIPIVLVVIAESLTKESLSLRAISFASLGLIFLSIIIWFWSVVGIWRSADNHVTRGGKSGWAVTAKIMVVLGLLAMTGQLVANIIPQVKELALIAAGQDPIGEISIKVATNGQSVIVIGTLREGSAAEIEKMFDAAPGATTLVLNSNGGRLLEAQQLARIVRDRGLNTYAEDQCVSACTYVFLAGKDRAATPNARIGFHQPSFPGSDAATQRSMTHEMMDVYRNAGLPESFVRRIGDTPAENMWYPTRDELIASHVITRVSFGGESAMIGVLVRSKQELFLQLKTIPLYQAIERRFPAIVDEAVERGWAVKERGGSDADIMNAIRSVISEIHPQLLKTADASILESFNKLMIDEMVAAREISAEACTKLLASQLDITKALPPEIAERERQFLMEALAAPPKADLSFPDPAQVERIIRSVVRNMPEQYINVMGNTDSYTDQPALVCGTMIAFYQGIEALAPRDRITVLQGLFQGKE